MVLGEGKPENQNAAVIFCFGEVVQVGAGSRWRRRAGKAGRHLWSVSKAELRRACCAGAHVTVPALPPPHPQAIDMNQDNYLAEALKMRNLVNEFNPPQVRATLHPCSQMSALRSPGIPAECVCSVRLHLPPEVCLPHPPP